MAAAQEGAASNSEVNLTLVALYDTDGTVLEVISSEVNMDTHADKALEVLRARSSA